MTAEKDRTRLIGDIARVLCDCSIPEDARAAALTFIGYLARRMPGEGPHEAGVHLCGRGRRGRIAHDGAASAAGRARPRWTK